MAPSQRPPRPVRQEDSVDFEYRSQVQAGVRNDHQIARLELREH